jgi:ABC-2 type transport system ATP-binding protein
MGDQPAQLGMVREEIADKENPEGWWVASFTRFDEIEPLLSSLRLSGCVIDELEIGKPDLEDVFVRVMQEKGCAV